MRTMASIQLDEPVRNLVHVVRGPRVGAGEDHAETIEGRARFQTRLVLERIAQAAADIDAMARALEGQAELVAEVLDDPDRGEEIGVPGFMRTPAFAADAWLRAAEIRRRLGELDVANTLLSQAARRLPESTWRQRLPSRASSSSAAAKGPTPRW